MSYACAEYLIYNTWTLTRPQQSSISGSLVLDFAMNKDEAIRKQQLYKMNHDSFIQQFPDSGKNTETKIIYIKNNPDWWPKERK
jgi:hypothetical protein